MSTYTQITYEQRCQIYALKDTGCSQQSMSDTIGVSQSAISRELKRNTGERGYRYKQAQSKAGRGHIKNRVSIDERPAIVDERGRMGDWEIDLVIGKGHSGALVTIVERETSFTVSKRINNKLAETVTQATIELLLPFKDVVLSITADNGKEFAYHEKMTVSLDAPVYFADPYSSWQRGLNENTNGLLRQYWPKCTDFKKVSAKEVSSVIVQLNNRPRKKFGYNTPAKLMAEYMTALAA